MNGQYSIRSTKHFEYLRSSCDLRKAVSQCHMTEGFESFDSYSLGAGCEIVVRDVREDWILLFPSLQGFAHFTKLLVLDSRRTIAFLNGIGKISLLERRSQDF